MTAIIIIITNEFNLSPLEDSDRAVPKAVFVGCAVCVITAVFLC